MNYPKKYDPSLTKALFANFCPFPSKDYAKQAGWPINEDGSITTPGVGRVPSRELYYEKLERGTPPDCTEED